MKNIQDYLNTAIRYPHTGVQILAEAFANIVQESSWFDDELKIKFCIGYMNSLLENNVPVHSRDLLFQKIKKKPIHFCIRLLKRYPDDGLQFLIMLLQHELRDVQKFKIDHLIEFHTELLSRFFPADT